MKILLFQRKFLSQNFLRNQEGHLQLPKTFVFCFSTLFILLEWSFPFRRCSSSLNDPSQTQYAMEACGAGYLCFLGGNICSQYFLAQILFYRNYDKRCSGSNGSSILDCCKYWVLDFTKSCCVWHYVARKQTVYTGKRCLNYLNCLSHFTQMCPLYF